MVCSCCISESGMPAYAAILFWVLIQRDECTFRCRFCCSSHVFAIDVVETGESEAIFERADGQGRRREIEVGHGIQRLSRLCRSVHELEGTLESTVVALIVFASIQQYRQILFYLCRVFLVLFGVSLRVERPFASTDF